MTATANPTSAAELAALGLIGAQARVPLGDLIPEALRPAYQAFDDAKEAWARARGKRWDLAAGSNDERAADQDRQDLHDASQAGRKPTLGKHVAALKVAREQAAATEEASQMNLGQAYVVALDAARRHRAEGTVHALAILDDRRRRLDVALAQVLASEEAWNRSLGLLAHWESIPTNTREPLSYSEETGPVRLDGVTVDRPATHRLLEPIREQVAKAHAILDARADPSLPEVLPEGQYKVSGVKWER